jgi:hypothetical protein
MHDLITARDDEDLSSLEFGNDRQEIEIENKL